MAAPEGTRHRGIFGISSPPRERVPVRDLPRPEIGTVPEAPPVDRSKPKQGKERQPMNLRKKIALGTTALAIAVAGAGGVAVVPKFLRSESGQSGQTETISGTLLDSSSFTPISKEEEIELWKNTKTVDLENHTFTIGFPVDQATIDKSPNLRMNSYFDQNLIVGPPTLMQVVEKLKEQGYKNVNQLSGLPKDTQIYYNYDSTKFDASIIKIAIAGEIQGEGSNSFTPAYTNYRIILIDKQTSKIYEGGINVLYGKPLVNPALFPTDHHPVYEDGTPIKPDEPILQLTTDLQDWDGKGQVLPGQRGQIVIYSTGGGFVSIGDAISDAQKGIYNPDAFFSPSFLKSPNGNIAIKQ